MYAIISTGGKQLKVTNDEVVAVERLAGNAGDKVTLIRFSRSAKAQTSISEPPLSRARKSKPKSWSTSAVPSSSLSRSNAAKAIVCAKATDRNSPKSKSFPWGNLSCVMMRTELCWKPRSRG